MNTYWLISLVCLEAAIIIAANIWLDKRQRARIVRKHELYGKPVMELVK